jgi:hypothetical protein
MFHELAHVMIAAEGIEVVTLGVELARVMPEAQL